MSNSLVAQRHVYDAIKATGGVRVQSFEISKNMISAFRLAHRNNTKELKRQKKVNQDLTEKAAQKRTLAQTLAELNSRKAKIPSEENVQLGALDDKISELASQLG